MCGVSSRKGRKSAFVAYDWPCSFRRMQRRRTKGKGRQKWSKKVCLTGRGIEVWHVVLREDCVCGLCKGGKRKGRSSERRRK